MGKVGRLISLAVAIYLGGAFFTYGWVYNSIMQAECGARPNSYDPEWNTWFDCDYAKRTWSPPIPLFSSVAWPIYWAKELAIWITR